MARVGGRDAVRVLRRLLESGDPPVRGFAAVGLGVHGDSADAAALERLLADPSEDVVPAATWALRRTGSAEAVPALVRVLDASGGASATVAAGALGGSERTPRSPR
ncbi:MAG: HEAT repeat domain-containing protein [Sandaracinaceae bacterium]|nr:HEAT repeat domain-containing protein [Sandaracinaceae bacterium]